MTNNAPAFDCEEFYANIRTAMAIEMDLLKDHSEIYGRNVRLKLETDTTYRGICRVEASVWINGTKYSTNIIIERQSTGYYSRSLGKPYAKVYRSAMHSRTKTFPQRKDRSFNYKGLVIEAISELESDVLAVRRRRKEVAGKETARDIQLRLAKEFGFDAPYAWSSCVTARETGKVKLSLPDLTEDEARAILTTMQQLGMKI